RRGEPSRRINGETKAADVGAWAIQSGRFHPRDRRSEAGHDEVVALAGSVNVEETHDAPLMAERRPVLPERLLGLELRCSVDGSWHRSRGLRDRLNRLLAVDLRRGSQHDMLDVRSVRRL